ncbi:hypothetical protein G7K_0211-t1 [Saitoella complicata NRRL Y-17804]|uniref:Uncharacterized protein n=1 Tax=Saitoella complicata (strain BCRC 22490 / CBS 7301 / JCM 7358 / NBRC 10748 / NRRL Y-17804) TaxID=698492 RepID=A0A0E9N8E2_SAICN|nr:hypothetical protein G7K_0211-t1 [Saitoella complicata NRRL Y-17804]
MCTVQQAGRYWVGFLCIGMGRILISFFPLLLGMAGMRLLTSFWFFDLLNIDTMMGGMIQNIDSNVILNDFEGLSQRFLLHFLIFRPKYTLHALISPHHSSCSSQSRQSQPQGRTWGLLGRE